MKNSFSAVLSVLLCIALVAGAVCLGARNGWQQERDAAIRASLGENADASFEIRAMDAGNLHVVASRHLPADSEQLRELRRLQLTLSSPTASPEEKGRADAALSALAQLLAAELPQLESVRQSPRDQVYITTLTRTLIQGHDMMDWAAGAQGFNDRLTSSLTGRLAMLLGVAPIELP